MTRDEKRFLRRSIINDVSREITRLSAIKWFVRRYERVHYGYELCLFQSNRQVKKATGSK